MKGREPRYSLRLAKISLDLSSSFSLHNKTEDRLGTSGRLWKWIRGNHIWNQRNNHHRCLLYVYWLLQQQHHCLHTYSHHLLWITCIKKTDLTVSTCRALHNTAMRLETFSHKLKVHSASLVRFQRGPFRL